MKDLRLLTEYKRARSSLSHLENGQGKRFYSKQLDLEKFNQAKNPSSLAEGILNESASLLFLSGIPLASGLVPRFVSNDVSSPSVLKEDLGEGTQLDQILKMGNSEEARVGLKKLFYSLATVHGNTIGREEQYRQIRSGLGHLSPKDGGIESSLKDYLEYLAKVASTLGFELGSDIESELREMLDQIFGQGSLLGLVHWDPCPDNCKLIDDEMKIYDFERASFANVFVDAVYARMRFPSCWCVADMPEEIVSEAELVYRSRLSEFFPQISDEKIYERNFSMACALWFLRSTDWSFDEAMTKDRLWGHSTLRQRFIGRSQIAARELKRAALLPELKDAILAMNVALRKCWESDSLEMPLYPAFISSLR